MQNTTQIDRKLNDFLEVVQWDFDDGDPSNTKVECLQWSKINQVLDWLVNTKLLTKQILKDIKGLLKDAEFLPSIIKDDGLRVQFCILLSLSNILFQKIKGKDILRKNIKISGFDKLNALITGTLEGLFTSYREISISKLNKKIDKK